MERDTYARITVRNDTDTSLILGKQFGNVFKPGRVYEVRELLDELIIRDIGPSAMKPVGEGDGDMNWGADANRIIEAGFHLQTDDEVLSCNGCHRIDT
jgi:hypothetical protein